MICSRQAQINETDEELRRRKFEASGLILAKIRNPKTANSIMNDECYDGKGSS